MSMAKTFFILLGVIFGLVCFEIYTAHKESNERFKADCIRTGGEYSEGESGLLCVFSR